MALNSSLWPRKPAFLVMIRRSPPSLLQMTPESKTASAVMYATSITISGSKNAEIHSSEETWQNSPKTRKCAWPSCTLCPRRLAGACPHEKLWGIGLGACDPRQSCTPLWPRPLAKGLRTYRPARQHYDILTKMRYASPLDILENLASPKLASMINCGVPA